MSHVCVVNWVVGIRGLENPEQKVRFQGKGNTYEYKSGKQI